MASGTNRRSPGVSFSPRTRGNGRGRGRGGRGNGRHNSHTGQRSGGNVTLGLGALKKLREKDPDDIVLDLASERCLPAFRELLRNTDMSNEMMELVLEMLAKACDSNSPEYFNKLLVELPTSSFVTISLKKYIMLLCAQGQTNTDPQLFLERTVKLFTEILQKIPDAYAFLPLGDLEQYVDILAGMEKVAPHVIQKVEQLKRIKKETLEKEIRKRKLESQKRTRSRNPVDTVGPPPEDFRELTIVPHRDDIFTEKKPYLRKNLVHGAYQNLDHYLDVQFRLLREDFLRPLREGILNIVKNGIEQQQGVFKDVRMYRNVKILHPVCSKSGLLHHIQFDNSRLKGVKWENSKRLIFGSLLCLSKDHFQTFVFATVGERDPKELAYGKITVQFMDMTIDLQDFSRKNVYEMVETTAYFEAYNPILEGLQQTNENDLPFQRYLVECNKDIQAPQYLRRNRFQLDTPSFDFSSILMNDASSDATEDLQRKFRSLSLHRGRKKTPQFKNVPVVDVDQWPSKEQLGLDESQYEALQTALTKEVAVIQGPPGTGKTFLGLKIAKLLLNNTNTWIHGEERIVGRRREVHQTPILVICFTNHALDQFLEGIYDFYGHNENKIVRIGGRSKSEKLEDCKLRAIKEKGDKKAPRYVRDGIGKVYSRLRGVRSGHVIPKSVNHLFG